MQNSWNKYGSNNFEFFVIENVDSKADIDKLEIKYIDEFRKIGKSFNILNGGGGRLGCPMSQSAKAIIGHKNKINMTGKKLSEATKNKMSISRTGQSYNRHKSTNILNEDKAHQVKKMLIDGYTPRYISENLSITYNSVNCILSNNTWSNVNVKGWDDFIQNRKTYHRLSSQDHLKICDLYYNHNLSVKELSQMYNKTVGMIRYILRNKSA